MVPRQKSLSKAWGALTAATPLEEPAIAEALDGDYRLRSGMKTDNGNVVRFFEAMKGDSVAMVINGEQGTVSRIDVLDSDIPTAAGAKSVRRLATFTAKSVWSLRAGFQR